MRKRICLALLLTLALLLCLVACAQEREPVVAYEPTLEDTQINTDLPLEQETEPQPQPGLEPEPEPDVIIQSRLAVAGDIVAHQPLNNDAYDQATGTYDYTHIYQYAADIFAGADYAVCNMETTFSGDGTYSGYPCFDSPPDMAVSLRESGLDLICTANNHSLDTGYNGLCNTLDVLDETGLAHIGTWRTQEERDENHGVVVADVGGVSIAFLAYTYGTNGIPMPSDKQFCVNVFNLDYMTTLCNPDIQKLESDMEYARSLDTDFIAVIMHWGNEYWTTPSDYQTEMADHMFALGADLVLGGHVHVPQPMEMREVVNGDGTTRTGYLCYCLGNFTSNQYDRYTNLTAIVNVDFEKNVTTGEAKILDVSYVPMYMLHSGVTTDYYVLLDIYRALDEYEAGTSQIVNETLSQSLYTALDDLHSIMGPDLDYRVKAAAGGG